MDPTAIKRHVLPGEPGGDTAWFYRQNSFEQQEIFRQVAFRRRRWPNLEDGCYSKRPNFTYPHILPAGHERLAFYEPLAHAIMAYLAEKNIALHSEALNLKSSQVACLNFLFPLRQDLDLARAVLQSFLPGLREVAGIEFEYTGPEGTTEWLGEPTRGKRGQNRTSIDAAIFWTDQNRRDHKTLAEWKYTERNFGVCSAFHSNSKEDRSRCESLDVVRDEDPARSCLLTTGGDYRSRHYWEHMEEAGISLPAFADAKGCPFRGPLYQLMRQFLLAAYLRQTGETSEVEAVAISFARNTELHVDDIVSGWNAVLRGMPPMRHWTVEQLMAYADETEKVELGWRSYLRERYDA